MNLQKRNDLIEKCKATDGVPGVSRITEVELKSLQDARDDAELSEQPAMRVTQYDDSKGIGFSGVMRLRDQYFPDSSVNFGPLLVESDRYEKMSAIDALHELIWIDKFRTQKDVRTIDVRQFFDGNSDENSLAPVPVSASFDGWRDVLLSIANRPDVLAVGASVFDLPSPEHREDDSFWIQAERWNIWTTAPLKEVRHWAKPLKFQSVYKVPSIKVRAPHEERLPPKTYAYALVIAAQSGVPARRCRGPIYRPVKLTYSPPSAERTTMQEESWHHLRERFIPSLEGSVKELVQRASDAYHEFGRTGIPSPVL